MRITDRVETLAQTDYLEPSLAVVAGAGVATVGRFCELIPLTQDASHIMEGSGLGVVVAGALYAAGIAIAHRLNIELPSNPFHR